LIGNIERALNLVKASETEPSADDFRERERTKRFIADCFAVKAKKAFICEQLEQHFGGRWRISTLDTFVRRFVTQDDLDAAVERFQAGELRGRVVVHRGKTAFLVEPETKLEFGPSGNHTQTVALTSRSPKHRASQLLALGKSLSLAMEDVGKALTQLKDSARTDNILPAQIDAVEESFRGILQAIYPVAVSALIDIKDRDARLGVLGTIAFDAEVPPAARIKAVETSSRILGDFQKARDNDQDNNLKLLAERIVSEGIQRTGMAREDVIQLLAVDTPEIIQWLQTPTKTTRASLAN
jgi:hypothetical protein